MPLATTLRSLAEANTRHWPLEVMVLTDGLAEGTRVRVIASLPPGSVTLTWRNIDVARFAAFGLMPHVSRMTFARFEIEYAFATDVGRIIYLDTDILVLGDLGSLFDIDLGESVLAAVPDYYIDASIQAKVVDKLAGVPRVTRYFNAGVLVINLDAWRSHATARSAIDYLARFPKAPYSDQDALNAVCDGRWLVLDGRWNYQRHHTVRIGSLVPSERPAVVHFITGSKPWLPSSTSLNAALYDSYRSRTEFKRSPSSRVKDATATFTHRVMRKIKALVGASARA